MQPPGGIPESRSLGSRQHPRFQGLSVQNGAGKSTLIEAIAILVGFNAEGGTKNFRFDTRRSESSLHEFMRPVRGHRRPRDGFFLRAESYFNVATEIERLGVGDSYGCVSLHEQSHGESFLALAMHRFAGQGLYILGEPEALRSPSGSCVCYANLKELHSTTEGRN